ncbi:hypothetical protein EK21DRAFT_83828 [Setomelanomma holmii]|uniref:Uncharacterized protein n=1 Tax=Setomelanomma holmii TaxID=210430 RepID=A0A9P4HJ36_9PLEO|nr:hypothetical protein EK21DRAFT_83828 [Setomelanomma holmii]
MPSTKRRRTGSNSSSSAAESDRSSSSSPRPHKSARKASDNNDGNDSSNESPKSSSWLAEFIDPIPHPECGGGFEKSLAWFIEENTKHIWGASPSKHEHHKWIIMKSCWHHHINTHADCDNGDKCCAIIGLLGCALLTTWSAIEHADELKPTSRFPDLALVISQYLDPSHDLPNYGIEGAFVSWRREAVTFFKKGKARPS